MSLLDRLLPPRCLLCHDPGVDGMAICAGCRGDLVRNGRACVRCAEPLPATGEGLEPLRVCGGCLWHPPPYAAIHVPFCYAAPLDWLLWRFKFHGDLAAGRLLGQLLAGETAFRLAGCDAIVPVPLHPRRLRERGYNQAAELARPLARALDARIRPNALARTGSTAAQMALPARERRRNVKGAFAPGRRPVTGRVVLIDDVVTTASTIGEAARALTAAAEVRVEVCALARA